MIFMTSYNPESFRCRKCPYLLKGGCAIHNKRTACGIVCNTDDKKFDYKRILCRQVSQAHKSVVEKMPAVEAATDVA